MERVITKINNLIRLHMRAENTYTVEKLKEIKRDLNHNNVISKLNE